MHTRTLTAMLSLAIGLVLLGVSSPTWAGDVDGDGVVDSVDVCNNTPPNTIVDTTGRPIGDLDYDCDNDLDDYDLYQRGFTGPLADIVDCNYNGIPDQYDIAGGISNDCQPNGIPDECDIAAGISYDLNTNGVPDECEVPPADMVLIPGGSFQMGDTFGDEPSDGSELPVHTVHTDAFYMGVYEVANQQYADALNWAYGQGDVINISGGVVYKYNSGTEYPYCDTTTILTPSHITWNGSTFGVTSGREDHPVAMVSWYGSVAYANWRSAMEGKALCYDLSTWERNFGTGYRLPTEAEWEKAARGGVSGQRFPWGNTINHTHANYKANGSAFDYDDSPYTSFTYHPDFDDDGCPYTSPVGHFAANCYGLCDMCGNVQEWCNDWYGGSYYTDPEATQPNPDGPATGDYRVLRGGGWSINAHFCRTAYRGGNGYPRNRYQGVGFRLVMDSN